MRPSTWTHHSVTKLIRVPADYADRLLEVAHQWDRDPADRDLRNLLNTVRCQRQREALLIEEIKTLRARLGET